MSRLFQLAQYLSSQVFPDELNQTLNLNVLFGPSSPPCTGAISMNSELNVSVFSEAFMQNVIHSQINLTIKSWRQIIALYAGDTTTLSFRVAVQLLLLLSKADVHEFQQLMGYDYSARMNTAIGCIKELFVVELEYNNTMLAKSYLLQPVVLATFANVLTQVLGENTDVTIAGIENFVTTMNIYVTHCFLNLRGAVLTDGILINLMRLTKPPLDECFELFDSKLIDERGKADRVSILVHETAHFLLRMYSQNYNFSTPTTGRNPGEPPMENEAIKLEAGRHMEVTLCGGHQPAWNASTRESAAEFLHQLHYSDTFPLPNMNFDLRHRPSLSFGIDFENEDIVFD